MRRRPFAAVATGVALIALTALTLNATLTLRPLPTIDGHYRFLGLHERAVVIRDSFGVPRIEANNAHDLFFLQGYVTAQDRFAQMETMRSSPEVRSMFVTAAASLDPTVGAAFDAYAAGVTKYIEQHAPARALPAEVTLRGSAPRSWAAMDSRAILAVYGRSTSRSSCVVATGERSARGAPLVAAELDSSAPAPGWYEVGLNGRHFQAAGLSLPGVPGILAGHNGRVAWSLHASEGRWGDLVAAETRIVQLLSADEATTFISRGPETGPFAGCLADRDGVITAFPPYLEARDRVGLLIAAARDEDLTTSRVPSGALDPEALRVWFGSPIETAARARIVIDLGDLDATRAALSTGQSAHPASRHYGDQRQLWNAGQLHRLPWTRERIARVEGELVLRPR